MSDTNVVDFAKYKKDTLTDQQEKMVDELYANQPVKVIDQLYDDVPESFLLVNSIGTYLHDERDMLVSKDGPTLFIKWGDNEYGLTIRPLDSHMENYSTWVDHVAGKYGDAAAKAKQKEPVDLTAEECMILNSIFDDSDESEGG